MRFSSVYGPLDPSFDPFRAPRRSFDVCQFNFAGCENLNPGGSCNVSCAAPYVGGQTTGLCPLLNTNPWQRIQFESPNCTLLCPEPFPVPPGYLRGSDRWLCAPGYVGTAAASCLVDQFFSGNQGVCVTRTELTGCLAQAPCVHLLSAWTVQVEV